MRTVKDWSAWKWEYKEPAIPSGLQEGPSVRTK